jgi:Mce-associated membrane protein
VRPSRLADRLPGAGRSVAIPLVPSGLVVLALVLGVLTTLLIGRAAGAGGDIREQVRVAAAEDVTKILSYDYRHLQRDFAAAKAVMTPGFRNKYDAETAKGVLPLATRYHAISTVVVTGAGVVSASASSAQVLVFIQQTSTNTQLTAPRLDKARLIAVLDRSSGGWRVDSLNPF